MADTGAVFVYVTAGDREAALELGRALVEERLAACANVIERMESVYWWQGELEQSREAVLILKSRANLVEALTERVRALHDYDCPCVVALPILGGNPDYLSWIAAETKRA
jgi:periplasmic divalent cation tolerance protein